MENHCQKDIPNTHYRLKFPCMRSECMRSRQRFEIIVQFKKWLKYSKVRSESNYQECILLMTLLYRYIYLSQIQNHYQKYIPKAYYWVTFPCMRNDTVLGQPLFHLLLCSMSPVDCLVMLYPHLPCGLQSTTRDYDEAPCIDVWISVSVISVNPIDAAFLV